MTDVQNEFITAPLALGEHTLQFFTPLDRESLAATLLTWLFIKEQGVLGLMGAGEDVAISEDSLYAKACAKHAEFKHQLTLTGWTKEACALVMEKYFKTDAAPRVKTLLSQQWGFQ